ncbi:MAG: polyphosphate polymerase domain-containing protein [Candidatus Nomurabacteria bacterium]|jgi:hypothetical protein|nr:polyphosphate polymerase domain-containing protein [Candidatus Nomurabacteria bacterium]
MAIEIFNRYENKYMISRDVYQKMLKDLLRKMKYDRHNKDGEFYSIYNVYYDTVDDYLIRRSLEKPIYKEKIRVRSYENPIGNGDMVFVELKKKFDGLVNKRRTKMTLGEAKRFLAGEKIEHMEHMNSQIVREIEEVAKRAPLAPKLNISYERMALFDREDDDLRVSFDRCVCAKWRDEKHGYEKGDKMLLPKDKFLMEVKVRWAMPLWLTGIIDKYKILPISFSKYGKEYVNKLKEGLEYV